MTQRVAIVGAGISGLSAAWSLMLAGFEVVVYEKDTAPGGHAKTIRVDGALVDAGVQVVNPRIYPNIIAMCQRFNVRLIPYMISYTLSSQRGLCGINHQNTAYWKEVEPDCVRFTLEANAMMALNSVEVISYSIGEYLKSNHYSQAFIDLIESLSSIIGLQEGGDALDTSLLIFVTAITSGMISLLSSSSQEFAFEGGVGRFIEPLVAGLHSSLRLGCGVVSISRSPTSVRVRDERGQVEDFDQIILCVDGLLAMSMLADPSPVEENLLSSCQLQTYPTIIHHDESVLIEGISAHRRTHLEIKDQVMTLNSSVLNLEKKELSRPLFMTYSDKPKIDDSKIEQRFDFRQAKDNTFSFELKKHIFQMQGKNRTWFAGGWTTMSTFEHAAVSGLVIAEALGATYPFPDDPRAKHNYQILRAMMIRGEENFNLSVT
jgi:predicted NAD/FAD-binding protein